jgi:hypothetical protein
MPRDLAPIPPALRPAVPPPIARLALRPREAAESLGLCERTLRDLPDVPRLKLNGGTVLYPVDLLAKWLRDRVRQSESPSDTESVSTPPDDAEGSGQ